jgi:hypothetical protein
MAHGECRVYEASGLWSISPWENGQSSTISIRPGSASGSCRNARIWAEPVSRNRPVRGSVSTTWSSGRKGRRCDRATVPPPEGQWDARFATSEAAIGWEQKRPKRQGDLSAAKTRRLRRDLRFPARFILIAAMPPCPCGGQPGAAQASQLACGTTARRPVVIPVRRRLRRWPGTSLSRS